MEGIAKPLSVHQFEVKTITGEPLSLADYSGKVLMIVNTASGCAFTPQLGKMQELYDSYREKNFELLAFPSNDFGGQEPLEGSDIEQFCEIRFQTHFPIFEKVTVKGQQAHPLFRFLSDKSQNGAHSAPPRWNFQKYLIDRQGRLHTWFYPFTSPTSSRVRNAIEGLL
ncbi:MAG: glutathione peroxidase [Bacteroidota bacterium]